MMSTGQVFTRVIVIGVVLGAVDAVAGRVLQAQADPSVLLSFAVTAWVAYRLAEGGRPRLALVAGLSVWVTFAAAFVVTAWLLVGWNGAVPWQPRSTTWIIAVVAMVPIVAVVAQMAGLRSTSRAGAKTGDTTPTRA